MKTAGYVPPPEKCERLAALVTRYGGSWAENAPAQNLSCEVPREASPELRAFLAQQSAMLVEAGFLARLPGGRVFGAGHVLAPDGKSLARDVSNDFGKAFAEHWLLGYQKMISPTWVTGVTAVVAVNRGAGYSHWLLEELPRLLSLPAGQFDRVLAHGGRLAQREALAMLGLRDRVIEARQFSHVACEELVVPSLVDPVGFPGPRTVGLLEEFARPLIEGSSRAERIYVSRENARWRRVLGEERLWSELGQLGFTKLRLEELSWREQINVFRGAKVVVAPHGAGLANLVFRRPGTRVVELFNRSYVNGCYWRLAAQKALDYRPLVLGADTPLLETASANRESIAVDLPSLLSAVA